MRLLRKIIGRSLQRIGNTRPGDFDWYPLPGGARRLSGPIGWQVGSRKVRFCPLADRESGMLIPVGSGEAGGRNAEHYSPGFRIDWSIRLLRVHSCRVPDRSGQVHIPERREQD